MLCELSPVSEGCLAPFLIGKNFIAVAKVRRQKSDIDFEVNVADN